jgi:ABC-type nickel/cobalt efflux system permease component RcnA
MSDHDAEGDAEAHADHGHGDDHADHEGAGEGRITSPMQEFGSSQVTTGFVVLVVGLVVVFGIPLLL